MNTILKSLITIACLAIASLSSLAQDTETFRPPSPNVPEQPSLWLYIVTSGFIGAAVILLSIMPSKRTDNKD